MTLALNAPYQLDPTSGLWARPGYGGIPYTDGIEIENHLYELVQSAQDRSVLSSQMRALCTDWVTTYHFSGVRANLLRPFEAELQGALTLEIGAGCGAITRYLAEAGAEVLALEGSPRRARIAQSRTEGLSNVTLLTDNFDHFETDLRFDVITLIGVLEYAGRFVQGANPTVAMLEKVRRLLKPNGRLIIAIENQYGLKYFAGALEDHVGQAMFGIEDRYEVQGVNTFGRVHLQRLLQASGFEHTDFYAPFPDYKLPVSIVSQAGFDHAVFQGAALACQSSKRDPQLPHAVHFAPDQVWPGLERNGLAMDLSNSFLIVAQPVAPAANNTSSSTLAWHCSAERLSDWCKLTTFVSTADRVQVRHQRLQAQAPAEVRRNGLVNRLQLQGDQPYISGHTMASAITRTLLQAQWTRQDLAHALQPYVSFVMTLCGRPANGAFDPHMEVPGQWLDAIPQNIVVDTQGRAHLIDEEWSSEQAITLGFLLYRAMQACALSIHRVAPCKDRSVRTPKALVEVAFEALGSPLQASAWQACVEQECELQTRIGGLPQDPQVRLDFLQNHRFAEHDLNTEQAIEIRALQHAVREHQAVITDRDNTVRIITGSRWWRLGAPVRWVMRRLKTP
jgi:2-polyprenyl-3-methyl-5-hydroxy-6-metoxy-1,4-benzoquinol methylase